MTRVTWFETNRSGSGVKPPACAWRDAPEALAGPDALLYKGFHPMAPESRMTPRVPKKPSCSEPPCAVFRAVS